MVKEAHVVLIILVFFYRCILFFIQSNACETTVPGFGKMLLEVMFLIMKTIS